MSRLGKELKSNLPHRTSDGYFKFPGPWVVWLGLIGFILGVTFCPFSPPRDERGDVPSAQERTIMMTSMPNKMSSVAVQPAEKTHPANFQTATFALG
jgi:hypothetical protein